MHVHERYLVTSSLTFFQFMNLFHVYHRNDLVIALSRTNVFQGQQYKLYFPYFSEISFQKTLKQLITCPKGLDAVFIKRY